MQVRLDAAFEGQVNINVVRDLRLQDALPHGFNKLRRPAHQEQKHRYVVHPEAPQHIFI